MPDNQPKQADQPNKQKSTFRVVWESLGHSIHWLIDLNEGLDREGTIVTIKNNKKMQGANAWLLMCSIMIASLGLDLNSPAVIIGAMLISPLMSPILGMGLSVGTNDREMLRISTTHFGIAIAIALVTSFIYFSLNPLGLEAPTPEIVSRTKPTLLDSLVAIFGGFAGIISSSRKDKTNAVPGVAIATALMPPLCVSGYGLANGDMTILANSFYLFFLNSFFVALSTFLIVRYLQFPVRQFLNAKERRRTTLILWVFSLALILPSAKILFDVYEENRVQRAVSELVSNYFNDYSDPKCLEYTYSVGDSSSILLLELAGKPLSDSVEQLIQADLHELISPYAKLYTFESNELTLEKLERLESQMSGFEKLSHQLDIAKAAEETNKIAAQQLKAKLDSIRSDTIPLIQIVRETNILFENIDNISFARAEKTNDAGKTYRIPTFYVRWKPNVYNRTIQRDKSKLEGYLKSRARLDTLVIERVNSN